MGQSSPQKSNHEDLYSAHRLTLAVTSAQRRGRGGKCDDGSKPVCADGSRPVKGGRGQPPSCDDGSTPACADGSEPQRPQRPPGGGRGCARSERVCCDGSAPSGTGRPSCPSGRPVCPDEVAT